MADQDHVDHRLVDLLRRAASLCRRTASVLGARGPHTLDAAAALSAAAAACDQAAGQLRNQDQLAVVPPPLETTTTVAVVDDVTPPDDTVDDTVLARETYNAYGQVTGFRNFQGDPMPGWDELGETIQAAWVAAADHAYRRGFASGRAPGRAPGRG